MPNTKLSGVGVAQSRPPLPPVHHTNTQTPPRRVYNTSTPPNPFPMSKQAGNHKSSSLSNSPLPFVRLLSNSDQLLHLPRKTSPLVWCGAIMCLLFCLLVIFFGIATVIVFLVIGPKHVSFDIPNARLNAIYFDTPGNFTVDFTFLANFTNPNKKISIRYEYLDVKLYLVDKLIAKQAFVAFSQKSREVRLETIHLISSFVNLSPNPAIELQRQLQTNRVLYNIRGTFRVGARVAIVRFSYKLHTSCQLEMTRPPSGILVSKNCSIERSL